MPVFYTKEDLTCCLKAIWKRKSSIGFVPTMGALHRGHLSLMEEALAENDFLVVSIFVNPTQFNNAEDLEKYPRTHQKDIDLIYSLTKDAIIYIPSVSDIYNENIKAESYSFNGLEHVMEGAHRPGHFDGVGTIVKMLFEITKPTKAYFGEKDFQQLRIIQQLNEQENLEIAIVGCPIFREENGLAMSSRNERLSTKAREKASLIFKTLQKTAENFKTTSLEKLQKEVETTFKNEKEFTLEYFEIAEEKTLLEAKIKEENKNYRAFIAVFVENIRLIDNIPLN